MKILYFDCFSGISGDMTLSALLDLGIDKDLLIRELKKLNAGEWTLEVSSVFKHGIGAKQIEVIPAEETHHHSHSHSHSHSHRNMAEIAHIIEKSAITDKAKELALRIFNRLAIAEAKVHGTTPDKVHFHEVGAIDSIIDIVGVSICIDILSPDKIFSSIVHDGYGFTKCQHGTIPIPVPAVAEVFATKGVGFKQLEVEGEMTTPTGAAIIAELAESFGAAPEMQITKTGYGAGKKEFSIPNLLRIIEGKMSVAADSDTMTIIETNIDDTTPEILAYVMERLFEAGVRDVFFTPIYMKKCRPATMLTVICEEDKTAEAEAIIFKETSTIGLRKYRTERICLSRKAVSILTPYGEVKAKEIAYNDAIRTSIEYDDACRLAKEKKVALKEILNVR